MNEIFSAPDSPPWPFLVRIWSGSDPILTTFIKQVAVNFQPPYPERTATVALKKRHFPYVFPGSGCICINLCGCSPPHWKS